MGCRNEMLMQSGGLLLCSTFSHSNPVASARSNLGLGRRSWTFLQQTHELFKKQLITLNWQAKYILKFATKTFNLTVADLSVILSPCSHIPHITLQTTTPIPTYPDLRINIMASSAGTMRGTPNRNQSRGTVPAFANSPVSNIPRPALEHTATTQSEAGGSTMSASRQKQTKRDEVCLPVKFNDLC